MKDNIKKKYISFKQMLSNNIYSLKLLWNAVPEKIIFEIIPWMLNAAMTVANLYCLRYVINGLQTGMSFEVISLWLVGFSVISIIYYGGMKILYVWLEPYFDYKLKHFFKGMIFKKSKECELSCYENPEFYDKYTRAMVECEERVKGVYENIGMFLYYLVYLFSAGALTVIIDPVTLIFIAVPPLVGLITKTAGLKSYELNQSLTSLNRIKSYTMRIFFWKDYAKEMKLTNIHGVITERFKKASEDTISVYKKQGWVVALLQFLATILTEIFSNYLVLLYAAWQTLVTGQMMYGDCLVLVTVVSSIYGHLKSLIDSFTVFYSDALYIGNLRYFMDYEPKIKVNEGEENFQCGDLKLTNVSFRYNSSQNEVLNNISLEIKQGEKIAIVGHNGAGKTTLVKLLLRLYDPTAGKITIEGKDIKDLNVIKYRDFFAPVLQDYKQLSMSVRDNVLLRKAREGDDDIVKSALKNSGIYDYIREMPNGIDTILGREFHDKGVILSGGQSQKISLAHVYACDSPVVILDEPSSALDPISEHEMYETMMRVCKDKTVIIISHRLSSAVDANRIYLMDQGKLIETGTHNELMKKQGLYFEMFNRQAENYGGGEVCEA